MHTGDSFLEGANPWIWALGLLQGWHVGVSWFSWLSWAILKILYRRRSQLKAKALWFQAWKATWRCGLQSMNACTQLHTTAYNRMWYRSPQDWPNGNAILYLNLFESLWFWKFHVQHRANILNAFDFRQVLCQHKFVVWSLSTVKPKTWTPAWFELERPQYHSSLVVSNDEMTRWWHTYSELFHCCGIKQIN